VSNDVQPFTPHAIEILAQTFGGYYTGSQITELFRRSGSPDIAHDGGTKWKFVFAAFERLQQQSHGKPHAILKVVETACNPQGWIGRREEYEGFLRDVNAVLEFIGLAAKDDGKLVRTGSVATTVRRTATEDERAFDDRIFHPQVIKHGRSHFARRAYFHAVFECCKAFDAAVRENTGIDESGQPLMSKAMGLAGPVKLNSQATQSHRDEQQGVMYLCMGVMNAVRNPQAHEPELNWPMSREDALDVLALVSFLYRKLERATVMQPSGASAPIQL
jgi:uncharacterized protein (TIGR02391 family)